MKTVEFFDVKDELLKLLPERLAPSEPNKDFTLIEGFFNNPMQVKLSNKLALGGPSVPMIALVVNDSGRMYFFALKALIPDVEERYGKEESN